MWLSCITKLSPCLQLTGVTSSKKIESPFLSPIMMDDGDTAFAKKWLCAFKEDF
jgi:hypothetical protein